MSFSSLDKAMHMELIQFNHLNALEVRLCSKCSNVPRGGREYFVLKILGIIIQKVINLLYDGQYSHKASIVLL